MSAVPAYLDVSTDGHGIIRKEQLAQIIAAWLVTASPNATTKDAITAIVLGAGINPQYIAELVKLIR